MRVCNFNIFWIVSVRKGNEGSTWYETKEDDVVICDGVTFGGQGHLSFASLPKTHITIKYVTHEKSKY